MNVLLDMLDGGIDRQALGRGQSQTGAAAERVIVAAAPQMARMERLRFGEDRVVVPEIALMIRIDSGEADRADVAERHVDPALEDHGIIVAVARRGVDRELLAWL